MDSSRIKQINELIKQKLSFILNDHFPDEIFSITEVKTSPDLSFSKVFVSLLPGASDIISKMNNKSSELRSELSQQIKVRHIPKIQFVIDDTEAYAEKIDNLFKKI